MFPVRPVVRTEVGELRGTIEESVRGKKYAAFKGIPYAVPPIGELRFRDSIPIGPWLETRDAIKFGDCCAQYDKLNGILVGSDDCLYLNVYSAFYDNEMSSSSKPVMFWIHGGAFAFGSGNDMYYGPDYIIEKDVVLVTVNYRLHALGFLNLNDEEAPGNQGLKDLVLALKWVRANIKNFGGDPGNVTIFGESAGGAAVHYLGLSPLAKGLFDKAIAQSGVATNPWASPAILPSLCAQKLSEALGNDAILDTKALIDFLRSVDAQKIAEAGEIVSAKIFLLGLHCFVPSIDVKSKESFLPISVKNASRTGVKVPFVLGHTSREGILFLGGMTDEKLKNYDIDFQTVLCPETTKLLHERDMEISDLKKIYIGNEKMSQDAYTTMQSDLQFNCGIHEIAEIQSTMKEAPTYLYKFSYDKGKSFFKMLMGLDVPGACHGDELPFIFYPKMMELAGLQPPELGSMEHLVMERIIQLWTNFARTGDPTPSGSMPVKWAPLEDPMNLRCLNIDENLCMESIASVNKLLTKKSTHKL